jgi:hypothetical protein
MLDVRGKEECLRGVIAVPKAKQVKSQKRQQATYPDRKISETFLDFAAPLLATMPDDVTEASVEKVLSIAFAVWNGIVLDGVNASEYYMTKVREQAARDTVLKALVAELADRKRTLFRDDQRLIGEYKVTHKHGQLNLWAEARDPYSIPRTEGTGPKKQEHSRDSGS